MGAPSLISSAFWIWASTGSSSGSGSPAGAASCSGSSQGGRLSSSGAGASGAGSGVTGTAWSGSAGRSPCRSETVSSGTGSSAGLGACRSRWNRPRSVSAGVATLGGGRGLSLFRSGVRTDTASSSRAMSTLARLFSAGRAGPRRTWRVSRGGSGSWGSSFSEMGFIRPNQPAMRAGVRRKPTSRHRMSSATARMAAPTVDSAARSSSASPPDSTPPDSRSCPALPSAARPPPAYTSPEVASRWRTAPNTRGVRPQAVACRRTFFRRFTSSRMPHTIRHRGSTSAPQPSSQ